MKKFLLIFMTLLLAFSMSACGHTHTWNEATCTVPKTCPECGETEGEATGHLWVEATCTDPKTCSICGETEGVATGHSWVEATCTVPKTCSICGETKGMRKEHSVSNWETVKVATCSEKGEESGVCTVCGEVLTQSIDKLEHTPGEWEVTKNATESSPGKKTQSCKVCGKVVSTEIFNLTPEEIEQQYKESCVKYDYKTIARDPDKYMFTYGKYTGKVVQVLEDGNDIQLRVNITRGSYGYYSDTIYVMYTKKSGESRILEDDIITLYGMNMGTISYESVLGSTITIPCVYAKYIDLK
ncbi:MAG: hypothetical protein ACI3XA_09570 [Clostridia bacterium]